MLGGCETVWAEVESVKEHELEKVVYLRDKQGEQRRRGGNHRKNQLAEGLDPTPVLSVGLTTLKKERC